MFTDFLQNIFPENFPTLLGIPLLLLASAALLFFIRGSGRTIVNIYLIIISFTITLISVIAAFKGLSQPFRQTFQWFRLKSNVRVSIGLDGQSALMLLLVVAVTMLVMLYSGTYMSKDKSYGRFFSALLIFTASMVGIIISFNLLFTFICWELVGFSSYLLINHWYFKPHTSNAARKAFIINRIADIGFIAGLGLMYSNFGTFELDLIIEKVRSSQMDDSVLFWSCFGIMLGCIGKSAQFPFLVWLPDAMRAPTPVSALLHAATMVAAGVFLLARLFPVLHPELLTILVYTGVLTSFIGAFAAATQTDIKKILAYSTISQLGYMVAGIGAHSYIAPLFHLFTHAVFKACLFLAAGAIIHALDHLKETIDPDTPASYFDTQDIRLMGGLRKKMPFTFVAFALASMAGAGVPFSSGFLSKDEILAAVTSWAFATGSTTDLIIPVVLFSTSLMTAFYIGRMFFLIFFRDFRLQIHFPELKGIDNQIHEAPLKLLLAYVPLSLLCLFIFFSLNPFDPDKSWLLLYLQHPQTVFPAEIAFLNNLQLIQDRFHYRIISVSVFVLTLGFGFSFLLYGFKTKLRTDFLRMHLPMKLPVKLSFNAFYLNMIYWKVGVNPYNRFSEVIFFAETRLLNKFTDNLALFTAVFAHFIAWFDKIVVDGLVNAFSGLLNNVSFQLKYFQNGKVQAYLVGSFISVLLAFIWFLF